MKLSRLKVNNQYKPCIDENPYFSWIIISDQNNIIQKSYKIIVYECKSQEVMWDSGTVKTDESVFINYNGKDLTSFSDYLWTVEVTNNENVKTVESSTFETGFINTPWTAKWIKSSLKMKKRKRGIENQNIVEYFRKKFIINSKVKRARVYATCHGAYQISMNGKRIDDRELAPEFTSYSKYLCYQTYDVTSFIKEGLNVLGMIVGDGWYNSETFRSRDKSFRLHHGVLFQLVVDYEDGSQHFVVSDNEVKITESPIRASNLFAGEFYDARMEILDWNSINCDDSNWKNGLQFKGNYENLKAQYGEPIRPIKVVTPENMYISLKGETIIDFGQNLAGVSSVYIDLPKDTQVILEHFETPDQYGNYFNNIAEIGKSKYVQTVIYISNGEAKEYRPHFTYHGFRYIRVTCDFEIKKDFFKAIVLSSDNENIGTFETSNPDINKLYKNIRWSQSSNMISIPTDCPQREKAGWSGDIQIYAKTALQNENVTPFLTRWLRNMSCEQKKNGAVPNVIPLTGIYDFLEKVNRVYYGNMSPVGEAGWGDAACIVPWSMYEITGNTRILKEQYNTMKKWCDYIITTAKKKRGKMKFPKELDIYLWNTGHQYGEWLIPSKTVNGMDKSAMKKINSSIYCTPIFGWNSCTILADTAQLLGYREDELYYRSITKKMKEAIQKCLINEDGTMPLDFMGGYVLMIAFGLVPENLKEKMAKNLIRKIEENNNCLDTGFLATPYILDALCEIGRIDKSFEILLQKKCPSWLYAVEQGATTIWENYISYKEDGTPISTSLNHYAFGCVDDWLFRKVAGINMLAPGFKKILISPELNDNFSSAKRTYMSEFGQISVDWEHKNEKFKLCV